MVRRVQAYHNLMPEMVTIQYLQLLHLLVVAAVFVMAQLDALEVLGLVVEVMLPALVVLEPLIKVMQAVMVRLLLLVVEVGQVR